MSSARRDGRPGYLAAAAATAFLSDCHLNRDVRQGPHRLVRATAGGRTQGGGGEIGKGVARGAFDGFWWARGGIGGGGEWTREGGRRGGGAREGGVVRGGEGVGEWGVFQAGGGGVAIADVEAAGAQAWFAHAPAGLYVLDTELRIVSAGLATQIMGGVPAERVLGRRLTDVHSLAARSQIEAMLGEVLDSGVPAPGRLVRMSLRDGPGRPCWVSAFRLEDQHGAVLGA